MKRESKASKLLARLSTSLNTTIDLTATMKQNRGLNQKLTTETRKLALLQRDYDLLAAKFKKLQMTNKSNNTSKNTWKGKCEILRTQVGELGGTVTPIRTPKVELPPPPAVPASKLSDWSLTCIEEHLFSRYRSESPEKPLFILVTEAASKVRSPPKTKEYTDEHRFEYHRKSSSAASSPEQRRSPRNHSSSRRLSSGRGRARERSRPAKKARRKTMESTSESETSSSEESESSSEEESPQKRKKSKKSKENKRKSGSSKKRRKK